MLDERWIVLADGSAVRALPKIKGGRVDVIVVDGARISVFLHADIGIGSGGSL